MSNLGYATALYVLALFSCKQPDLPPRILEVRGNRLLFITPAVFEGDEVAAAMKFVGEVPAGCRMLLDFGATPAFIQAMEGHVGSVERATGSSLVLGPPLPQDQKVICGEYLPEPQ